MKLLVSLTFISLSLAADSVYLERVKPLLEKNCLSCHGDYHLETWYRGLPIIENIIKDHQKEAKSKLDLTNDSFFKGKGSQADIYWSIARSIESDRMPPYYFKYPHLDLQFNDSDKKFLVEWFKNKSKELMQEEDEK
ncbi:MAG: heme-binding domain-containing protein [Oligoflexia bacterium]|nr:heme-binding domain-containing protein [Oligoflexia bacterium]